MSILGIIILGLAILWGAILAAHNTAWWAGHLRERRAERRAGLTTEAQRARSNHGTH